jgi:uncharacterized protein involved in response to NO
MPSPDAVARPRLITRATLGHTAFLPSRSSLENVAAISRVLAACGNTWTAAFFALSATLWIEAFAGFVVRYGPMLLQPRVVRQPCITPVAGGCVAHI